MKRKNREQGIALFVDEILRATNGAGCQTTENERVKVVA
jgi:hypothetical protein